MTVKTTRYVAATKLGKQLFIVIAPKAKVKRGEEKQEHTYGLTEDLNEATKTLNKISAQTLIQDYLGHTGSTRTFGIRRVATTFELEDFEDGGECNTD